MSNMSLDLSNRLPVEQVNIVRQVVHAAENLGLRLFIVGAKARDFLLQYVYALRVDRATNDIDFAIVVETWDEFSKLRDNLIAHERFRPCGTMKQRLVHESGILIDLVPFGGLEEVSGQISWPPDFSIVMSTVGFREAYDNSIEVRIAEDLIVRVASLAGLALMKIVAWDDRRFERDAQDLGLIMRHYLAAGNDGRVYSEQGDCFDLLNEEFDYDEVSARILGRDVGRVLTDISRPIVDRAFSHEAQQSVEELATAMIRNRANYYGHYDVAMAMLAALRSGISESDGI